NGVSPNFRDGDHNCKWTFEENKLFENGIAQFDPGDPDFFEQIAATLPRKTIRQVEIHFQALIEEVGMIESGLVPLPSYKDDEDKGDWRSISRKSVVTRTPAQVASHAQKYFIRLQNSTTTQRNNNASSTISSASIIKNNKNSNSTPPSSSSSAANIGEPMAATTVMTTASPSTSMPTNAS
ncbi:hypothetical protein Tsubulata_012443, partial [Turnera subulata]